MRKLRKNPEQFVINKYETRRALWKKVDWNATVFMPVLCNFLLIKVPFNFEHFSSIIKDDKNVLIN